LGGGWASLSLANPIALSFRYAAKREEKEKKKKGKRRKEREEGGQIVLSDRRRSQSRVLILRWQGKRRKEGEMTPGRSRSIRRPRLMLSL